MRRVLVREVEEDMFSRGLCNYWWLFYSVSTLQSCCVGRKRSLVLVVFPSYLYCSTRVQRLPKDKTGTVHCFAASPQPAPPCNHTAATYHISSP